MTSALCLCFLNVENGNNYDIYLTVMLEGSNELFNTQKTFNIEPGT